MKIHLLAGAFVLSTLSLAAKPDCEVLLILPKTIPVVESRMENLLIGQVDAFVEFTGNDVIIPVIPAREKLLLERSFKFTVNDRQGHPCKVEAPASDPTATADLNLISRSVVRLALPYAFTVRFPSEGEYDFTFEMVLHNAAGEECHVNATVKRVTIRKNAGPTIDG